MAKKNTEFQIFVKIDIFSNVLQVQFSVNISQFWRKNSNISKSNGSSEMNFWKKD